MNLAIKILKHWQSALGNDERLVPDLPRGRGRSIGGDLDVGEEGSKQTIVNLQSLHHSSIGYLHDVHELASPRRLIPASATENTSKNRKECN
jgi:hypothetical protein